MFERMIAKLRMPGLLFPSVNSEALNFGCGFLECTGLNFSLAYTHLYPMPISFKKNGFHNFPSGFAWPGSET